MGACCNGDTERGKDIHLSQNGFKPIDRSGSSQRGMVSSPLYDNLVEQSIANIDVIEGEIAGNAGDAKWNQAFEEEYQSQYVAVKGMFSMGQLKGKFNEDYVKLATLRQMKKNGILQNAINWQDLSEGKKIDAGDVIDQKFCVPNCVKKHQHNFMYDFNKTYKDPIYMRPGECFDLQQDPCMIRGTPINLESRMAIKRDFEDTDFKFNYEVIDPKYSYKFNQSIESFFFPIKKAKKPGNNLTSQNYLSTSTIGLFDPHIQKANFFAQQFHFHSPAEHSIDGQLMDLEMHIVHFIDEKIDPTKIGANNRAASQFFAGVLGFIFKVMPDSYFASRKVQNPDILYHDKFLSALVDEEKHKQMAMDGTAMSKQSPLNLKRFVELVDFNRRFTYQGSLTTAPLVEGILWNVIDTVIPITQATMDQFTDFRRVQEEISTNYIVPEKTKEEMDKFGIARSRFPESHKCQYHEGSQFMKVAMCNRQVQDTNQRPVYHIAKTH